MYISTHGLANVELIGYLELTRIRIKGLFFFKRHLNCGKVGIKILVYKINHIKVYTPKFTATSSQQNLCLLANGTEVLLLLRQDTAGTWVEFNIFEETRNVPQAIGEQRTLEAGRV